MTLTGNSSIKSSFCSVRYGTMLDSFIAHHILRKFPLFDKLVEVDIKHWDGVSPLPHCLHERGLSTAHYPISNFISKLCGYPAVTVLNGCISSKELLFHWQQQQIKKLGLAEFRAANKRRMSKSKMLHSLVQSWLNELRLNGKIIKTEKQIIEESFKQQLIPSGYIESILPFFKELSAQLREDDRRFITAEKMVYNHHLIYKGKFDAIIPFNDELLLVDWKGITAGSSKSTEILDSAALFADNKMQLSAYVKAVISDMEFINFHKLKRAGIIRIFETGREAEVVIMDEEEINHNYELYKGWINAFWWTIANTKPISSDLLEEELFDFRYEPKK